MATNEPNKPDEVKITSAQEVKAEEKAALAKPPEVGGEATAPEKPNEKATDSNPKSHLPKAAEKANKKPSRPAKQEKQVKATKADKPAKQNQSAGIGGGSVSGKSAEQIKQETPSPTPVQPPVPREAPEMSHIAKTEDKPDSFGFLVDKITSSDKIIKYGKNNKIEFSEHPLVKQRGAKRLIKIYAAISDKIEQFNDSHIRFAVSSIVE